MVTLSLASALPLFPCKYWDLRPSQFLSVFIHFLYSSHHRWWPSPQHCVSQVVPSYLAPYTHTWRRTQDAL